MTIVKRSGEIEELLKKKIFDSICNANSCVNDDEKLTQKQIRRITDSVYMFCEDLEDPIDIDVLEDVIEKKIMEASGYDVAKRYITYRYEKERVRMNRSLTEKLTASNVQNQNANIDEFSFGGRIGETAGYITKQYALDHLISKKAKQNHINNEIYIHDLDSYAVGSHNCLSIPFDDLLKNGFNTRQTDIRPAGSINTAMQLVAVIFQLQSLQQFGGVSATHLDWTMIPYVRKSFWKHYSDLLTTAINIDIDYFVKNGELSEKLKKLTTGEIDPSDVSIEDECYVKRSKIYPLALDATLKELDQSVEGMYHNLNTLQSRSGNQLPFSSINYGTCTLPEGRMVTKALIKGCINGCGKFHTTSIFPCGIFQCKKGINLDRSDKNYDLFRLALESTAKRIYPNYANCDFSGQVEWVKYDRTTKEDIIKSLSAEDVQTLISRLEENHSLCKALMLDVKLNENNEKCVTVRQDIEPIEIMSTMGCRTQNGADVNFADSYRKNISQVIADGTLYDDVTSAARKDSRGNICPVTIILPTLAMKAKNKVKREISVDKKTNGSFREWPTEKVICRQRAVFLEMLSKKINEAKDMLIERFDWICSQPAKSAMFMYENRTMCGYVPTEGIRSALKHGTLAIGQLGLAEALQLIVGCDQTTKNGMEFAIEIESLFKEKCAKFKQDYMLNFGVYYTPAENLCFTAMKKFKEAYGEIKNVSDHEYFTNSMHVPVWCKMDPFKKIDIESQLTTFSSAGCITYVEMDASVKNNIDAMEKIVRYAMEKDIPYFAVNVPIDTCECGYQGDLGEKCPKCGSSNIKRLRRVTGYITGNYTTAFNRGKQQEVEQRVKHTALEVR